MKRPRPRGESSRKRTRRSRRIAQQRGRRRRAKELNWLGRLQLIAQKKSELKLRSYKDKFVEAYGFCADPKKPTWNNLEDYLLRMTPNQYFARPTNMACHNYCTLKHMPAGTKILLGLGLKYAVKRPRPTNLTKRTLTRFKEDVRRKCFWLLTPPKANQPEGEKDTYIPGLYIKSNWIPPECKIKELETAMAAFE